MSGPREDRFNTKGTAWQRDYRVAIELELGFIPIGIVTAPAAA